MNYLSIYNSIIKNAKRQGRKKTKPSNPNHIYYEKHHIIPRCIMKDRNREYLMDQKWNLVLLTAREHFICHRLLVKITKDTKYYYKMIYALNRMINKGPDGRIVNILSGTYSKCKNLHSLIVSDRMSKHHHMKGNHHSEDTKAKISKTLTGRTIYRDIIDKRSKTVKERGSKAGPNHHNWGIKHTDEYKIKMSESCSKIVKTAEWNAKNSQSNIGKTHIANTKTKKRSRVQRSEALILVESSGGEWIFLHTTKPIPDYIEPVSSNAIFPS